MKRIKTRRKHFRITNPLGFSLFCASVILVVALIAGIVFLAVGGYFGDALKCVKAKLNGDDVPTPTEVIAEEATAELANGVLYILLPKPEAEKPKSVPVI